MNTAHLLENYIRDKANSVKPDITLYRCIEQQRLDEYSLYGKELNELYNIFKQKNLNNNNLDLINYPRPSLKKKKEAFYRKRHLLEWVLHGSTSPDYSQFRSTALNLEELSDHAFCGNGTALLYRIDLKSDDYIIAGLKKDCPADTFNKTNYNQLDYKGRRSRNTPNTLRNADIEKSYIYPNFIPYYRDKLLAWDYGTGKDQFNLNNLKDTQIVSKATYEDSTAAGKTSIRHTYADQKEKNYVSLNNVLLASEKVQEVNVIGGKNITLDKLFFCERAPTEFINKSFQDVYNMYIAKFKSNDDKIIDHILTLISSRYHTNIITTDGEFPTLNGKAYVLGMGLLDTHVPVVEHTTNKLRTKRKKATITITSPKKSMFKTWLSDIGVSVSNVDEVDHKFKLVGITDPHEIIQKLNKQSAKSMNLDKQTRRVLRDGIQKLSAAT